jgi:hypothetical protein
MWSITAACAMRVLQSACGWLQLDWDSEKASCPVRAGTDIFASSQCYASRIRQYRSRLVLCGRKVPTRHYDGVCIGRDGAESHLTHAQKPSMQWSSFVLCPTLSLLRASSSSSIRSMTLHTDVLSCSSCTPVHVMSCVQGLQPDFAARTVFLLLAGL